MSSVTATLSKLIQDKINANMKAIGGYDGPLSQKNPSYFIAFCNAIATGISDGSKVINFTTADAGFGGLPSVPGVSAGVGIKVDKAWFDEFLYTEMRKQSAAQFGSTLHGPYSPPKGDTGEYLHAVTKGVADSVAEHFLTAYNLTGAHPLVYAGTGLINEGHFFGLDPDKIAGLMFAAAPQLRGLFWPTITKAIAKIYVQTIHQHSTAKVIIAGVCVPMTPPAGPLQVCAINMVGVGTGTAV